MDAAWLDTQEACVRDISQIQQMAERAGKLIETCEDADDEQSAHYVELTALYDALTWVLHRHLDDHRIEQHLDGAS